MGSAAISSTSSLLLNPIKGTARFIKDSLTSPSLRSPSVKSSDVFPVSQQISSFDIFPQSQQSRSLSSSLYPQSSTYSPSFREQYGINQPLIPSEYPPWHPSSNPPPSPYPITPNTSVSSQIPTVTLDSLNLITPSSASASALPQGMRSYSILPLSTSSASAAPSQGMRSASSASAVPSKSMRSSSLESYDVIPPEETAQYLAPIPEYNQQLAAS